MCVGGGAVAGDNIVRLIFALGVPADLRRVLCAHRSPLPPNSPLAAGAPCHGLVPHSNKTAAGIRITPEAEESSRCGA